MLKFSSSVAFFCSLAAARRCASWLQIFQCATGTQAGTAAMLALIAALLLALVSTAAEAGPSGLCTHVHAHTFDWPMYFSSKHENLLKMLS